MSKVPIAGQNQHYLAIGSRLNCLIVASADFQKHEDLARHSVHLISKLLVNTAGQPLDFPNDLTRFHNMLCTNHPLPTFLHKCTIFAGQVEHANGKKNTCTNLYSIRYSSSKRHRSESYESQVSLKAKIAHFL